MSLITMMVFGNEYVSIFIRYIYLHCEKENNIEKLKHVFSGDIINSSFSPLTYLKAVFFFSLKFAIVYTLLEKLY